MEHSMERLAIHPFPYDGFQQRAIERIDQDTSLFVAAPTGAGKTVLADYVIERSLARGRQVIYTAPIKALSNQKFRDFAARHGERVGIMTGDVTINPTAPLIIMTTEIYRNSLLEAGERLGRAAWVIFDEVHFLDDAERGTVWEEAILFTPPHINLLCLSATIPNVEELAHWIRRVHQRPIAVIEETHRPVPLTLRFQCHNAILQTVQELKGVGYQGVEDSRGLRRRGDARHRHGRRHQDTPHPNRVDTLIRELIAKEHLPCIFFTFGRRRAEDVAWELSRCPLLSVEEGRALRALFDELCARFHLTHDAGAQALGHLMDRGVGFHHAGMLPTLKEVLERCFTSRLMKVIVTTETFALGVNMPARSVVLDALRKRGDRGVELLRRREFLQMSGRAGRRGMDDAGFVYLRVNPAQTSFGEVQRVIAGPAEPVHSRFNMAYATLLNLYRRHGRGLLAIFPKTLFAAQTSGARRQQGQELLERKLDVLEAMGYVTSSGLTRKGELAAWLYGHELVLTELYAHGRLAALDATALAMLMAALVYEPRPHLPAPKLHALAKRLAALCQPCLESIQAHERRFRIHPPAKTPVWHLTQALEAWMAQAPFERVTRLAGVDDGELVRYFRMAVQLLRQLADTPAAEPALRATAARALPRLNRDVVDAEAQLRLG
jgi:superfamily II RNA helicase